MWIFVGILKHAWEKVVKQIGCWNWEIVFVLVEIYMEVNLETSNTLFLTASLFSLIELTTPRDITI